MISGLSFGMSIYPRIKNQKSEIKNQSMILTPPLSAELTMLA
jgi:hypothetical protein